MKELRKISLCWSERAILPVNNKKSPSVGTLKTTLWVAGSGQCRGRSKEEKFIRRSPPSPTSDHNWSLLCPPCDQKVSVMSRLSTSDHLTTFIPCADMAGISTSVSTTFLVVGKFLVLFGAANQRNFLLCGQCSSNSVGIL